MNKTEIEKLPEIIEATKVLRALESEGLLEPYIANGWTRGFLTNTPSNDIDISYVGPVHYNDAQEILRRTLDELKIDPAPWDIEGIWNAEMAYELKHNVEYLLIYCVDSIDSIYLASDGKLHDPTGHGFADAESKTLRMNDYDQKNGIIPVPQEEVNTCLEGCRRMFQLGWAPTDASVDRIKDGVKNWARLDDDGRSYFFRKLAKKFPPDIRVEAQKLFARYGWGFVFDELREKSTFDK